MSRITITTVIDTLDTSSIQGLDQTFDALARGRIKENGHVSVSIEVDNSQVRSPAEYYFNPGELTYMTTETGRPRPTVTEDLYRRYLGNYQAPWTTTFSAGDTGETQPAQEEDTRWIDRFMGRGR